MKYKLLFHFFISLIFYSQFLFAQNKIQNTEKLFGADTISWKENSPLHFSDFKAKPSGTWAGNTYSGITLAFSQDEKGIHLMVQCVFLCKQSFLKDTSLSLLHHEQLHFDLTELYRRKMMQQLSHKDFSKEKNIGAAIQKIYNEVNEQLNKEQDNYDKETQHGIIPDKQKLWEQNVQKQLKQLEGFSGNEIIID